MVKATQKDHAQPNIVTALDTIPTVSHLDKSSNYTSTIRFAIVALKDAVNSDLINLVL